MHSWKSGPAFTPQAEAVRALGDVFYAWLRTHNGPVFADVMPAWDRALSAMGYHFTPMAVTPLAMSQSSDVLHSVIQAMTHTGTPMAEIKWRAADAAMRGLALAFALRQDHFASSTSATAWEQEREHDADMVAEIADYQRKAAELRAWAGVR